MTRIYQPYIFWEDWINGMYDTSMVRIEPIIDFTGNYVLYGNAMQRVVKEWTYCVEHNLSNTSINRKAWLGHAACNIQFGWPEYAVRKAWWHLSQKQRYLADNEAVKIIDSWELNRKYDNISKHGNKGVTHLAYQMRFPSF